MPFDPAKLGAMAKFLTAAEKQFLVNERILLFGPPKHGKTTVAATFSDKFVGFDRPKGSPIIKLDDLVWLAFDPNPLVGIVEQGYDVPVLFDLSKETGDRLLPAIDSVLANIEALVDAMKPKVVVVDTVSFLDKSLNEFFARKYDKWDLFRMVNNAHTRFVSALKLIKSHVIVIAHAKAESTPADAQGQAVKKSTDLPGSGGISSQITGATKGTYEGMVSMILPMQARDEVEAGKPVRKRFFYPTGAMGFEGAGRYLRYLAKEEPADFKLLFDKIRRGKEAEWSATSGT